MLVLPVFGGEGVSIIDGYVKFVSFGKLTWHRPLTETEDV